MNRHNKEQIETRMGAIYSLPKTLGKIRCEKTASRIPQTFAQLFVQFLSHHFRSISFGATNNGNSS